MQRAEALLIRARLAAVEQASDAAEQFAAAIEAMRPLSTPYHLAHGLLDHAKFLAATDDSARGRPRSARRDRSPLVSGAGRCSTELTHSPRRWLSKALRR